MENKILTNYGCQLFNDEIMRDRLPNSVYKEYKKVLKKDIHQGVKDTIKKWISQL